MLYENVVKLCTDRNITVAALEKELSLANATIRRWKNSSPSVANAEKVAAYFGVTLDELVK